MKNSGKLVSFLVPIISILLAFVIGCIIMAVLGANPFAIGRGAAEFRYDEKTLLNLRYYCTLVTIKETYPLSYFHRHPTVTKEQTASTISQSPLPGLKQPGQVTSNVKEKGINIPTFLQKTKK